ncbi:hypothetical protein COCOBI_10-0110 [Coccomyxa sp. Obi]|nr:hypothetical protein COCOBI_10-0110 [Coccomyxa sp. Obi]
MASRITLRTVARSQTLWTRPVSTTGVRAADKDDKSMYDKVKDKAGEVLENVGQAFTESGKVGKQFTEHGKVGGKADKAGGPLDRDGEVGHQFTTDGAVGGRVEKAAEKTREAGKEAQKEANKP